MAGARDTDLVSAPNSRLLIRAWNMPAQHGDCSHLSFLEPVFHYIKAIFAARTPAAQATAFNTAQTYFSSCLQDNRTAAQQLRAERLRLLQECQVPVHYVRHCRLICARNLQHQRSHQIIIQEINCALHILETEERHINNWKSALAHTTPAWVASPVQHQQQQYNNPITTLAQPQVVFVNSSTPAVPPTVVVQHNAQ